MILLWPRVLHHSKALKISEEIHNSWLTTFKESGAYLVGEASGCFKFQLSVILSPVVDQ